MMKTLLVFFFASNISNYNFTSRSKKVAFCTSCSSSKMIPSSSPSGALPSTSVTICWSIGLRNAFSIVFDCVWKTRSMPTLSGSERTRYSIPTSSVGTNPAFFRSRWTRFTISLASPSSANSGYKTASRMISTSSSVFVSKSLEDASSFKPRLITRSPSTSSMPSTTIFLSVTNRLTSLLESDGSAFLTF
ncbi:hypothetical protein I7I48_01579 [Histoplasma ohiense]|nr:hypothetical protein I7I48_01579 [Histoplasma ohiense (nom. inval.)]